nr:hypothetical protein GCM10025732_54420 [Glycomyces mayteni]
MTGLPIIETKAGDISQFIPTNVISITDGQVYLEEGLFNSGVRPAINVGTSVSRVGGAAQTKGMRSVAGSLRLDLAQYRDLEAFAAFASDLDAASRAQLDRGLRMVELLKQGVAAPLPMGEETISIWAGTSGALDDIPVGEVRRFENEFLTYMRANHKDVVSQLNAGKDKVAGDIEDTLTRAVAKFKQMFKANVDDLNVTDIAEDALEGDVDVETVKRVKKG